MRRRDGRARHRELAALYRGSSRRARRPVEFAPMRILAIDTPPNGCRSPSATATRGVAAARARRAGAFASALLPLVDAVLAEAGWRSPISTASRSAPAPARSPACASLAASRRASRSARRCRSCRSPTLEALAQEAWRTPRRATRARVPRRAHARGLRRGLRARRRRLARGAAPPAVLQPGDVAALPATAHGSAPAMVSPRIRRLRSALALRGVDATIVPDGARDRRAGAAAPGRGRGGRRRARAAAVCAPPRRADDRRARRRRAALAMATLPGPFAHCARRLAAAAPSAISPTSPRSRRRSTPRRGRSATSATRWPPATARGRRARRPHRRVRRDDAARRARRRSSTCRSCPTRAAQGLGRALLRALHRRRAARWAPSRCSSKCASATPPAIALYECRRIRARRAPRRTTIRRRRAARARTRW